MKSSNYNLLKGSIAVCLILFSQFLKAQSVAINNTGATAHPSALLDLTSSTKGILIPRMTTMQRATIATPQTGLLIFNTTDNEYNYYDGTLWQPFGASLWQRNGTSILNRNGAGGVRIGTNTLPTANLQVARGTFFNGTAILEGTNYWTYFNYGNLEHTYIRGGLANSNVFISDIAGSSVGIGTTNPFTKLHVAAGFSGGSTTLGSVVFEHNTDNYATLLAPSANESGLIFGNNLTSVGAGIVYNNTGNTQGLQFRTNGNVNRMQLRNNGFLGVGTGIYPDYAIDVLGRSRVRTGNGSAGIWYNNNANTGLQTFVGNYDDNNAGTYGIGSGWSTLLNTNTGNFGVGGHLPYGGIKLSVEAGSNTGLWIRSNNVYPYQGWNFSGVNGHNSNFAAGDGIAVSGVGHGIISQTLEDNDVNTDHDGGFFLVQNFSNPTSGPRALASVASLVDNTTYKILGFGVVSTIVKDKEEKLRIMAAPESPEVMFTDYGVGQLVNGKARIDIDPTLTNNILVDDGHPIKIFVQLEGDCNGVYVTNKSAEGFDVIELKGGSSNTKFSWTLAANRADEKAADGQLLSRYTNMRFKELKPKDGSKLAQQVKGQAAPPLVPQLLPKQN